MGFLDCLFDISAHLVGRAAQSRLATADLAAGTGSRYLIPLRDLFRGRKIVAQTLCIRHLLHLNDPSVAKRCGSIHYQSLMQVATSMTVHSLNLFGISALQHGNVIEVKTGYWASMKRAAASDPFRRLSWISLFLGELYRANWQRRVVFLVAGVMIAFLCNVGRTFFLCWIASKDALNP